MRDRLKEKQGVPEEEAIWPFSPWLIAHCSIKWRCIKKLCHAYYRPKGK
jgi:hypothetical protein